MPRSNRPRRTGRPATHGRPSARGRPARDHDDPQRGLEISLAGMQRIESHPDGEWVVRRVTGAAAVRGYVCPGCAQQVTPGTAHVVAWPSEGLTGAQAAVEERRHWHTPCWQRRASRRPR